jgi:serine/threonine protein kinase
MTTGPRRPRPLSKAQPRYCPLCDVEMDGATCAEHGVPTLNPAQALNASVEYVLDVGSVFAERYVIERVIAHGGTGTVFVAMQRSMNRKIALKVLQPQFVQKGPSLTRFYLEARAMSRLDHPNIVRVHEFGVDDRTQQPFLAMTLVEGHSLGDILRASPLDERRAARLLAQVARALVAAHAKQIIHRDLKPENIMVETLPDGTEHVLVLDFGMARIEADTDRRTTKVGTIAGTPAYMSPEQASSVDSDARTDLYSLGCILHECLAGRPPFDDPSSLSLLLSHVHREPPPLPELLIDGEPVSPALDALRRWLLQKEPERRPPTAKVVLDALTAVAEGNQAAACVAVGLASPQQADVPPEADRTTPITSPTDAVDEFAEVVVTQTEPAPPSPRAISVREYEEGAIVALPSMFDEYFDGAGLAQRLSEYPTIVFDFDRVRRMSSHGIREWMHFLQALPTHTYYCFVRCHPHVVAQFNVLAHFGERGELVSLYLPYVCPQCDDKIELLVDVRREKERFDRMEHPPLQCARCRIDSELDDLPEIYFMYVASRPRPAPPEQAAALLEGLTPRRTREQMMSVRKELSERMTMFRLAGIIDDNASFRRLAEGVEGPVLLDLAEVSDIRGAGVLRLLEFLAKTNCDIHVANAPLRMLERLFEDRLCEQVRFTTVTSTARCQRCGMEYPIRLSGDRRNETTQPWSCCGVRLGDFHAIESRLMRSREVT